MGNMRQFIRAIERGYYVAGTNTPLKGVPANINRHTGKPHEHKREITRNTMTPNQRKKDV